MEDLIKELQSHLTDYFQLMVSQDDGKFKRYEETATDIIETWREWMEDFFFATAE